MAYLVNRVEVLSRITMAIHTHKAPQSKGLSGAEYAPRGQTADRSGISSEDGQSKSLRYEGLQKAARNSPKAKQLKAIQAAINDRPQARRVAQLQATLNRRAVSARREGSGPDGQVVQRALKFGQGFKPAVQQLVVSGLAAWPGILDDPNFVLYITLDPEMRAGQAGNTEYGAFIGDELKLFGSNLKSVYEGLEAPPKKLYAYITINPNNNPFEIVSAITHEISLHARPLFNYKETLLSEPGGELETLKELWPNFVTRGPLSEDVHHARFGAGNTDLFLAILKQQLARIGNPDQQGKLIFNFLSDYLSKLSFYKKNFAKSPVTQPILEKELFFLLDVLAPYEDSAVPKGQLARDFDEIVKKMEEFKQARAEAAIQKAKEDQHEMLMKKLQQPK